MVHVESSNIKSLDYSTDVFVVVFNNGSVYKYEEVPPETVLQVTYAKSVGRALNQLVVGKYEHTRIL